MGSLSSLQVIIRLSLRNIVSSKIKSLIIGFLMLFGTMLVVLGTALLDTVEKSMTKSITSSVAGHIQVYSKDAKDPLKIFGSGFMASDDYGMLPDFKKIKTALSTIPNVDAVVPMGIQMAMIMRGNDLDKSIESLRRAVNDQNIGHIEADVAKIRQLIQFLRQEYDYIKRLARDKQKITLEIGDIEKALSEEFWQSFRQDPQIALQFLDTHIAPLLYEGDIAYVRFIGTDLELFQQKFESFAIAKGEMIPPGKRGFLFNQGFYDKYLKNKAARDLDELYEDVVQKGKTLAKDTLLQAKARECSRLYKKITFQLSPENAQKLEAELRKILPEVKGSLNDLVQAFLLVNDDTLRPRYTFFYDVIAPMIDLYSFKVGDTITLRTYTKSGYIKARNVKVYGTFQFKGIEESDIAGAFNIIDMITFRELYGLMGKEEINELADIKKSVGVADVRREDAENALFGESATVINESGEEKFNEFDNIKIAKGDERQKALQTDSYTREDVENGLALNAAVILKDPRQLKTTLRQIKEKDISAGLNIQAIDWEEASGVVGQFMVVIKIVLYIAIFIIFLVAMVIINNSMIMATMERIPEIGTMRAIGAQSRFVLILFLMETIFLGVLSGGLGALLGAGIVIYLGQVGIPAFNNVMVMLFSGPRLYPAVGLINLGFGFIIIFVVSIISTLYPAYVATNISPATAMERRE